MTTTYELEVIEDGVWEKVISTTDPFEYGAAVLERSFDKRSIRSTTLQSEDPLAGKVVGNVRDSPGPPWLQVKRNAEAKRDFVPTAQQPTIGRIVHYCTHVSGEPTVVPAIITQIGKLQTDERTPDVKLTIFWPDDASSMPNGGWHVFSEEPRAGHWSWPPRN